jgi:hypothetical protein
MLGIIWYFGTIVAAFIWLLGSPLYPRLTVGELVAASIPVGTIGAAWIAFLIACLLSALR